MPTDPPLSGAVIVDASVGDPLLGRDVGGYLIEAPLSSGGMGLVYRARHPLLGRAFAVKVLRPEFADDDQLNGNFVREAQTLSGLKHPNIIDIVGFGPLDGQRQYMVMEFLEGRSLQDELHQQGPLPLSRVLELAEPILSALEAAHSVDVIHRDLKPANVFLSRISGGGEVVKLLDFGLAKLQPQLLAGVPGAAAGQSVIAGTPEYIAPEQALGKAASRASDLYSFGVLLFELLTGQTPFVAADGEGRIKELLELHVSAPAPGVAGACLEPVPEDLERLVEELLRKDPLERPPSAAAVRQRLRRLQREVQQASTRQVRNPFLEVPEAPPVLVPDRPTADLGEALRPRRWPVLLLGVSVMLLVVALAGLRRGAPVAAGEPPSANPASLAAPPVDATTSPAAEARPQPGVGPVASPTSTGTSPPPANPTASPPRAAGKSPGATPPSRDDELAPLAAVAPSPKPARRTAAPTFQVTHFECEPDEAWRAASRGHLQELQQLAAARGQVAFTRFEALEPRLSKAIDAADDGAACDAVDRRIRQLAKELSP